ncbi:MAG: sensor histidine kinase [Minwuia sp.]|uniref:sensor histidine kinase n=1 Tax=Minwuia sp. TaxID=2493630 RepID=UPI003A84A2EC
MSANRPDWKMQDGTGPEGPAPVRFRHSVRLRFLLVNLPIAFLLVFLILGAFYVIEHRQTLRELTAKLDRMVVNYGILVADPLLDGDTEQVALILAASTDDPDLIGISVSDAGGRVVARIGTFQGVSRPDLIRTKPLRMATADGMQRIGTLHVMLDDTRLQQTTTRLAELTALLLAAMLVATLISSLVAHESVIGGPLRRLLVHIRALQSGNPGPPPRPGRRDELGVLTDAFNRLQDQQQKQGEALRAAHDTLEARVRERTTELQVALEAAESASRAKSQFLANLSHELRTPLNAISGFAEVLKTQPHGPLGDSRYLEYAADIGVSADHLMVLINGLLDLSKAEAGKMEPSLRELDVGRALEEPMRLLRVQAEAARLRLSGEIPDDLPPVIADPQMVRQIVLNLLSNAIKFTPRGGHVTLSAMRTDNGFVRCEVRDTGIGIAEADIPRLLQPFEQADNGLDRRYAGTGLGLPLANVFTELLGGEMQIESVREGGTCVSFTLPAADAEDGAASLLERQA